MSLARNLSTLGQAATSTGYIPTANVSGTLLPSTIAYGGGAVYESVGTISSNYTMTAGRSGMSAGPITINTGVTVTLPTGSRWIIL